ncbi:uncharacterized protein BDZ99DRAFT_538489 [Mytilinidion resinicola]|uniref:Uncharacterized protein n=1 Tax=Mytilinidion resinicola TaxID=574789 RepID=A0A6A6YEL3_9PEZI|nr:uncharacterized protein BDZ99DRAFT_538489 [Mytilinidion resinicola]KAF2806287.1 hypothetical protein BDZ99DRAFT_538489 [Mytilinidion resinicola]
MSCSPRRKRPRRPTTTANRTKKNVILNPMWSLAIRNAWDEAEICKSCGEVYDAVGKYDGACDCHDGELRLDEGNEEFWSQHPELRGRIRNTEKMRQRYAGAFTWDCCGKAGDAEEFC